MQEPQAIDPLPATGIAPADLVQVMPVEVPMLDESAWREYRGQPGRATANSTHIAVVADETGVERLCFVKLAPDLNKPTLLCEALGWVLAGHAGVRRASFAAIILVDKVKLAKSQELTFECSSFPGDFIPAWCSEAIPGNSVLSSAKSATKPGMQFIVEHKTFLNSADARKMAAFDQWTGLRDRNMGNVIRLKAGGYASIDHETVLHDTLWGTSDFNHHCLVKRAEKVLDAKRIKAFKVEMTRAAAGHSEALTNASRELQALLELMLPGALETHASAMAFLSARSQAGWLAGELGVLDMAPKDEQR